MSDGLVRRRPTEDDHPRVLAVMTQWWGGVGGDVGAQQRALLLPRLFFQHFAGTSQLVEDADGQLMAFLIGFVSQSDPGVGYVHFVGVGPSLRRSGFGADLYRRFFTDVGEHEVRVIKCLTSPANTSSVAFHQRIGFTLVPSATVIDGVAVHPDYDGPGLDRVCFVRHL
jgi:ribosomal protein S18 acetylase RimI-like enzyme